MFSRNKSIFLHYYIWAALLVFSSGGCRTVTEVQLKEKNALQIKINEEIPEDSSTKAFIKPYKDSLDKIMNEVLGVSSQQMEKGKPESTLGNFVADLSIEYINKHYRKADMAFFNLGGLRSNLPEGNITRRNIYELMPFDNEIVVLELSGNEMRQLLNFIAETGGIPVGGIKMKINKHFPEEVYIANSKYDSTKTYNVITSDYLANGGDNLFFLKDAKRYTFNLLMRDMIILHIKEQTANRKILQSKTDGRIIIAE